MSAHLPLSDAKFKATEVKKKQFPSRDQDAKESTNDLEMQDRDAKESTNDLEMQDRDAKESTNDLEMQDRDAKESTYTSMSNNGSQFGEEGLTQH